MKKALITEITGQDGAYLAKFLFDKGYRFMQHLEGRLFNCASRKIWDCRCAKGEMVHLAA